MLSITEERWIEVFATELSLEALKIAADWFEEQGDTAHVLLRWMVTRYERGIIVQGRFNPTDLPSPATNDKEWWWIAVNISVEHGHRYSLDKPHSIPRGVCLLANDYYHSPQAAWRAALYACRIIMRRDGRIE